MPIMGGAIRPKYPPTRAIAVDVDGTLMVNGRLNAGLVAFCEEQKRRGYELILWSARGREYARKVADAFHVLDLFDVVISKPGYIVDDQGWEWARFTRWIRRLDAIGPDGNGGVT